MQNYAALEFVFSYTVTCPHPVWARPVSRNTRVARSTDSVDTLSEWVKADCSRQCSPTHPRASHCTALRLPRWPPRLCHRRHTPHVRHPPRRNQHPHLDPGSHPADCGYAPPSRAPSQQGARRPQRTTTEYYRSGLPGQLNPHRSQDAGLWLIARIVAPACVQPDGWPKFLTRVSRTALPRGLANRKDQIPVTHLH